MKIKLPKLRKPNKWGKYLLVTHLTEIVQKAVLGFRDAAILFVLNLSQTKGGGGSVSRNAFAVSSEFIKGGGQFNNNGCLHDFVLKVDSSAIL